MNPKSDMIDVYQAIATGLRKGTDKQKEQVNRMRAAFCLVAAGYSIMKAAEQLEKQFDLSIQQSANIVSQALKVFGKADAHMRQGMKYAGYENLMRLAKLAEEDEDYVTARLLIKDAHELMGLHEEEVGGYENPEDYMQPTKYIYTDDPAMLNAAKRILTLDIQAEDAEIVNEEDAEGSSSDNSTEQ
jgi:hypothetical protein